MQTSILASQSNARRERAAALIAAGQSTLAEVAVAVDVTEPTLWRWRRDPAFQARVAEREETITAAIIDAGIASRAARVEAATDRWLALRDLIEARATHFRQLAERGEPIPPGAETGLLKPVRRRGGVVDYELDVATLREMRELEQQIARELGQWSDRPSRAPAVGGGIEMVIPVGGTGG